MYVYVIYSRRYPYLPIAVADSAREAAELVGRSVQSVRSCFSKRINGYEKVWIEED